MSEEGKKKRGASGMANAKDQPWRLGQYNAQLNPVVPKPKPVAGSAFDGPQRGFSYREAEAQDTLRGPSSPPKRGNYGRYSKRAVQV